MKDEHAPKDCWSSTPYYRPGTRLTAEQLNAAQEDAVRRDRLVNVAMHGVGVAYGFEIRTNDDGRMIVEDGCIYVSCGLAFDRYGRMLFWRGGYLHVRDIVGSSPQCEGKYTLVVHYAEQADRDDCFDPCSESSGWVRRCVAFTLKRDCEQAEFCAPEIPEDECMTRRDWICIRNGFQQGAVPMDEVLKYACADPEPLKETDCGRVAYDPYSGIPLSCLEICDVDREKEDCHPRYEFCHCGCVESCCIRPVAYRNQLLYELINLDDVPLAKVESYSWSRWELKRWSDSDRMPFSAFRRLVKNSQQLNVAGGLSLMFDRPVQRDTLHPMSVILDIYILETRADYWEPWRIPLEILHLDKHGRIVGDDWEDECVWGVLIKPEDAWIEYEIDDKKSTILDCANRDRLARVEIKLRCQIIRDCCGLMLDARPVDIDLEDPDGRCKIHCGHRAGQDRTGGDFLSLFRIGRDKAEDCDDDEYPDSEEYVHGDKIPDGRSEKEGNYEQRGASEQAS